MVPLSRQVYLDKQDSYKLTGLLCPNPPRDPIMANLRSKDYLFSYLSIHAPPFGLRAAFPSAPK